MRFAVASSLANAAQCPNATRSIALDRYFATVSHRWVDKRTRKSYQNSVLHFFRLLKHFFLFKQMLNCSSECLLDIQFDAAQNKSSGQIWLIFAKDTRKVIEISFPKLNEQCIIEVMKQ